MPTNNWIKYVSQHLFNDEQGFHQLPYLSNNPAIMVESILALPISDHDANEQAIYTDNPYTQGCMRYRTLAEGLSLICSSLEIKKNIISKALYHTELPADHYFLSFAVFEYQFPTDDSCKNFSTLLSTTCTFYKPGTKVTTYFYEGTSGKFFNLVFSKEWAEANISFKSGGDKEAFVKFLDGKIGFINWLDIVPNADALAERLWDQVALETNHNFNIDFLKKEVHQIISDFFQKAIQESRIKTHQSLNNNDYAIVATAEKNILRNLTSPFIGVEQIARAVHVSPTKLKGMFKTVFGFSILQYHKEKNMLLALQLLQKTTMQVQNIAAVTGYGTVNKFNAAFKKRFEKTPTSLRNGR